MREDGPTQPRADRASETGDAFLRAAVAGLTGTPKRLPGTFLWDEQGSILFERITDHPDYYPARCEMALLPGVARELADRIGPGATIVEYGSGANRKIRTLLDALPGAARVVSIDISREYLEASAARLAADYPAVEVTTVCADYGQPIRLPADLPQAPVLGFFPGTAIGNISPEEVEAFLRRVRDTLGSSLLLIGADPTQDLVRLRAAYGDCGGLMPAFHLNLIARLNRELGTRFDASDFRHELRFPGDPFRVEAHLVALRRQSLSLGGTTITFEPGESVRTDTSHKYRPEAFRTLAERGGWSVERAWFDPDGLFGLHLLSA